VPGGALTAFVELKKALYISKLWISAVMGEGVGQGFKAPARLSMVKIEEFIWETETSVDTMVPRL